MNKPNPFLTTPLEMAREQEKLYAHMRRLTWQLRDIENALDQGIPWNHLHASEWRDAKRVADRIKEKYGDLSQEDET